MLAVGLTLVTGELFAKTKPSTETGGSGGGLNRLRLSIMADPNHAGLEVDPLGGVGGSRIVRITVEGCVWHSSTTLTGFDGPSRL